MKQECQELENFAKELNLNYKISHIDGQYKVTEIEGTPINRGLIVFFFICSIFTSKIN